MRNSKNSTLVILIGVLIALTVSIPLPHHSHPIPKETDKNEVSLEELKSDLDHTEHLR